MKIIECEQRSELWIKSRVGLPTASNFDEIVKSNGEQSAQRKKYLYRLAGESVTGKKEESTYTNEAMQRGIELEGEARQMFEIVTGLSVTQVGLCVHDNGKLACSPDGLIEDKGGIEIKCPSMAIHVGYLLENKLPTDYYQQVQGSLAVTDREFWYFVSYYPAIRPLIVRVQRDEMFIGKLMAEINAFHAELQVVIDKIKEKK